MTQAGVAESLIETEIGCGPFQVLIVLVLFLLVKIPSVTTFVFMAYGNYNPGWRCLDNVTYTYTHTHNASFLTRNDSSLDQFTTESSCAAYEACRNVEFNPESSTIVTEWSLVCDKAWIASLIISLQMAGNMIGSTVSGQLADTIGRKKTLYGSLFVNGVVTFASIFSPSWQVFAVFRFFLGLISAFFESLNYVYPAEFLTKKWRGPMAGIPGWCLGGVVFGLTTMALKDWRHVLVVIAGVCLASFVPVVWTPESLRWLEVKNKEEQFQRVAKQMARLNGVSATRQTNFDTLNNCNLRSNGDGDQTTKKKTDTNNYTLLDLFRPGYRKISSIVGIVWMTISLIYYAISFGVRALSGDFYINYILMSAVIIPCAFFPFFAPNLLGRRTAACVFCLVGAVSLFSATGFELLTSGQVKLVGTLVFVMVAQIGVDTSFIIDHVHLSEMYPTAVRGLAINGASLMARVGGIIAPFIIPNDAETVYVWYLVMGCLAVVCAFFISRLPETKGMPLKETFDDLHEGHEWVAVSVNGDGGEHDVESSETNTGPV